MRIEMFRQRLRDAGNADVPGDVPRQFALRQAEIAELARNQSAVMVAGEQKRRASRLAIFADRWNIFRAQE